MCKSVPQMPVLRTRISTSLIPISGSGTSRSVRPGFDSVLARARMKLFGNLSSPGEMAVVDLNADVGEGFPADAALFRLVTSANVACVFHAGDTETMRAACERAAAAGPAIGAHVSYRDREGFGRRPL